jgi:hypothetical protein
VSFLVLSPRVVSFPNKVIPSQGRNIRVSVRWFISIRLRFTRTTNRDNGRKENLLSNRFYYDYFHFHYGKIDFFRLSLLSRTKSKFVPGYPIDDGLRIFRSRFGRGRESKRAII